MKVIVGKCIAGLCLNRYAVKELVKRGSKLIVCDPIENYFGKDLGEDIKVEFEEFLQEEAEDIGDGFLGSKHYDDYIFKDGRHYYYPRMYENRDDKIAVEFFEEVGVDKVGRNGITIVEIPDDIEWEICAGDDGWEWIAEKHRTW